MTGQTPTPVSPKPGSGSQKTSLPTSQKVEIEVTVNEAPRRKFDWGTWLLGALCLAGLLIAAWRPWL